MTALPRLYYFPTRGRGEQVRLLFHALEQPFEDLPVRRDHFAELKKQGPAVLPFGALPVLEDGALRLAQGPVIMGYLARKHGIAPADLAAAARADALTLAAEDLRIKYFGLFGEGAEAKREAFLAGDWRTRWLPSLDGHLALNGSTAHFVGATLTHADVALWDVLNAMVTYIDGASLAGFERLQAFYDALREQPGLAAYLAERPPR